MQSYGLHEKQMLNFIVTCPTPHFFYQLSIKKQHKIGDEIENMSITKCWVEILTPNEHPAT